MQSFIHLLKTVRNVCLRKMQKRFRRRQLLKRLRFLIESSPKDSTLTLPSDKTPEEFKSGLQPLTQLEG